MIMKIKKGYRLAGLISCTVALSVAGVIYFKKYSSPSPPEPLMHPKSVVSMEPSAGGVTSARASLSGGAVSFTSVDDVKFSTALSTNVGNMSMSGKKALIQSRRDKIELLIAELDKSRDNPAELKRLDAEIKRYIANYNQLLLPVIVAEQALKK